MPTAHYTSQGETASSQVSVLKGQQEKYNEFEHLHLNHVRPFQIKLTEEEKLQFFLSFLKDVAIEFWQTLHINLETTLQDALTRFRKKLRKKTSRKFHKKNGINLNETPKPKHSTNPSKNSETLANKHLSRKPTNTSLHFCLENY